MEEIGDKRFYITSERERERETDRESACLRVLLHYKVWDTVLYKWPTWEQGWLTDQSAHPRNLIRLFFRISSEMDVLT